MTTDGLIDQIGGPRGRSFGKRRFQELLRNTKDTDAEQAEAVRKELAKYQGQQISRDDLTILGFVPHGVRERPMLASQSLGPARHAAQAGHHLRLQRLHDGSRC